MQIVIDIPDEVYKELTETAIMVTEVYPSTIERALTEGIVLPKGHGRLVDENDLVRDFSTFQDAFVINVAHGFELRVVCTAPTIVEADKEVDDATRD